ncbi:MAG: DEAD/DEAH box helicase [Anaerolineae bacterium]|nr:DEAD/DEAH box helicase [Anaerolineae bacterium]
MHVLHAHWHYPTLPTDEAGVLFWAENSEADLNTAAKGRKRKGNPHPFCIDTETVRDLFKALKITTPADQFNVITLLLPSIGSNPQPSPQLIHDWELDDNKPPVLSPWLVTGLWLSPVEAFRVLLNLPAPDNRPPQLAIGADTFYWQLVSNLVLEALSQQKLLPTLAQADARGNTFHARWMPVLDGTQDGPRLAQLLESMPPLCRAEAKKPEEAPSPRLILDTFLNTLTDSLARQWSNDANFLRLGNDPAYAWLQALVSNDPNVAASPAQLKHLSESHRLWLRNLHVSGDKTFRVAFRLEAPSQQVDNDEEDKSWQLHYLLQARDDPSLLVAAQQVWQSKGSVLNTLNRRFEQPQEKLLTGLGFAARLFPPLTEGLKTSHPTKLPLSTQESFDFLRESAPLLEASGFGVLVPPWWNKPGTRLGVRLRMSSNRSSQGNDAIPKSDVGFEKLIRYKWELSLGDTTLTQEEFKDLVSLKSPLVQIRGQWVQLDPEQIEAAIRFWKKQDLEADVSMQEAMRIGLGTDETVEGLPVENVEFEGWLKDWMERFTGNEKLEELPQPDSLQAQLRPYQLYGYSWLDFFRRWHMGACLADDMGLGKTIQTIAMLLRKKEEDGELPAPTLLICPTSVVANWAKEIERFAPTLTTMTHQGSSRLRDDAFISEAKSRDMVLTSYALARRDSETLQKMNWFGLILDEAQNIKNPDAKQTRAIRQLDSEFRLALTGTPVENRLSELWSIMQFLNPSYLGSRQKFRKSFALPIERYNDEKATQNLRKMVSPFVLRRVKTDPSVIQDLPDKQEMKVYCNLSEEQATLYESVVQSAMQEVAESDGIKRRGIVLGMLMKLKQICNHPAQFLHQMGNGRPLNVRKETGRSGKLERLAEMLEEAVSVDDRVLIFTQFAEMGHFLKSHLQESLGVPAQFLHGGTSPKKRAVMIERFQEDANGPPIFILSIKAGGTGLNLTRANHVFHFDRWWNPAVEDQATDRAFRIGQKQNVQVHKFVCIGTMEEMVDKMIEDKKALAQSVVGGGENWLTELSTNELRDMVTLRQEAVG